LIVCSLQAEEKRREGSKDHGPDCEQDREFAWCEEIHAREDNRTILRMCFKLELIPHYAVADAAAEILSGFSLDVFSFCSYLAA
jgi:hypothetical protein